MLVFTRYPEPGTTKKRLIPALGAQGAANLQGQLTSHTLEMVRRIACHRSTNAEVHFTGGDEAAMRNMFGDDLHYRYQAEGSLGNRLYHAFEQALDGENATNSAIAVGTDCPSLNEYTIRRAFAMLARYDVVLGPSVDGGYYLIGLCRPIPELFQAIDWGTSRVLTQTRHRAERRGLCIGWLEAKKDIDKPEDLHEWTSFQTGQAASRSNDQRLSVIIPALNEAAGLPRTLSSVGDASDIETIVVDGGSRDETPEVARSYGAHVVMSAPSRAIQMNTGADVASGDVLMFLHADTRLPFGYHQQIERILARPDVVGGSFRFAFDNAGPGLRFIEMCTNYRSIHEGMPYGDQTIFLPFRIFHEMQGFCEFPVMEDYDFVRRLRKRGRIGIVPVPVTTSARRWLQGGVWRTTLKNRCVIMGWHLRIPPKYLARLRNE